MLFDYWKHWAVLMIRIKLRGRIRIPMEVISWIRIRIHIKVKGRIRIRIKVMRISNTDWKYSHFLFCLEKLVPPVTWLLKVFPPFALSRKVSFTCCLIIESILTQSCESRRQTISSISRPRFREIWKVSALSRLLPLLVSPGSRPLFGFWRPNPAENESPIANR